MLKALHNVFCHTCYLAWLKIISKKKITVLLVAHAIHQFLLITNHKTIFLSNIVWRMQERIDECLVRIAGCNEIKMKYF
jgi:hypothetical protein